MVGVTKHLIFLMLVILCTSISDNREVFDWSSESNQNGNLDGFYADSTYCNKISKLGNVREYLLIFDSILQFNQKIEKKLQRTELYYSSNIDSLYRKNIEDIEEIIYFLVEFTGGFCVNKDIPILPLRKKENKIFWNIGDNLKNIHKIIQSFNSDLSIIILNLTSSKPHDYLIIYDISNLGKRNVIDSLKPKTFSLNIR